MRDRVIEWWAKGMNGSRMGNLGKAGSATHRKLSTELSTYLDGLRIMAAFAVLLMHVRAALLPQMFWQVADHGREAVAIFFVLSGFLIRFANVERGERSWRVYTAARLARIYPVAILALLITVTADAIGLSQRPGVYLVLRSFNPDTGLTDLMSALLFINEAWFRHSVFGSNEPYWSLGFEVPYYILFALIVFSKRWWRGVLALVWAIAFGPKILAYLPTWLLGTLAYEIVSRRSNVSRQGLELFLWLSSALLYICIKRLHLHFDMFDARGYRYLLSGSAYNFFVGVSVAANIVGFDLAVSGRLAIRQSLRAALAWVAGGGFSLYLLHLPFIRLSQAMYPSVSNHEAGAIFTVASIIALSYLLAQVGERPKRTYRRWVRRALKVED